MHDDNPHLRSALRLANPDATSQDDDSGLPSLRDGEYQPFARPANKPLYAIHFVDAKGEVRSFQYAHLDSDSSFAAEQITLRFLGMEPIKVIISGRNLWRLYDYIHQHRCAWVMVSAQPYAKDGDAIVTNVHFTITEDVE